MLSANKKSIFILVTISILVVTVVLINTTLVPSNTVDIASDASYSQEHNTQEHSGISTIATEWQWADKAKQSPSNSLQAGQDALPFTPKFVYEALKAVRLDENGDVIYDHDALLSLDEALLRIQNKLNAESLLVLQNLIRESLPGKAGEQTAKVVGDYYYYLEAKETFDSTHAALSPSSSEQTIASLELDEALYYELQALRDAHLGSQVSNGLFRVSDATAEFMFDSMKLALNSDLSEEQRELRQIEIEKKHIEGSVNIDNWPTRYKDFLREKNIIIQASLSQSDKQYQVSQLLSKYFNQDERQRISHLELDQL